MWNSTVTPTFNLTKMLHQVFQLRFINFVRIRISIRFIAAGKHLSWLIYVCVCVCCVLWAIDTVGWRQQEERRKKTQSDKTKAKNGGWSLWGMGIGIVNYIGHNIRGWAIKWVNKLNLNKMFANSILYYYIIFYERCLWSAEPKHPTFCCTIHVPCIEVH